MMMHDPLNAAGTEAPTHIPTPGIQFGHAVRCVSGFYKGFEGIAVGQSADTGAVEVMVRNVGTGNRFVLIHTEDLAILTRPTELVDMPRAEWVPLPLNSGTPPPAPPTPAPTA